MPALLAELERLGAALKFYADEKNWGDFKDNDGNTIEKAVPMASWEEHSAEMTVSYCDCGQTARDALSVRHVAKKG